MVVLQRKAVAACKKLYPVRMQKVRQKSAFGIKTPRGFSQGNTSFLDPDQG